VPIFEPRLTRREQAKYLTVAEELLAGGIALEIPAEWRDNARALHIEIGGPPASTAPAGQHRWKWRFWTSSRSSIR